MNSFAIIGIGWVNGTGMGKGPVQSLEDFYSEQPLPLIKGKDLFESPNSRFGRLDAFSKIGFAGISLAVQDAGLEQIPDYQSTGIIAVTDHGCSETDLNYFKTVMPDNGLLSSPNLFAYTLSSCFMGEASIQYQLRGENFILTGNSETECRAIQLALIAMMEGKCENMIVGLNNTWTGNKRSHSKETPLGSVFIVISKSNNPSKQYGHIIWNDDQQITFDGQPLQSILRLVLAS